MEHSSDNFTPKPKYRAIALVATPILIAGGVYVAWNYASHLWKKQQKQEQKQEQEQEQTPTKASRLLARCVSLATLHGGSQALERLRDYHYSRANAEELESALTQFKSLIQQEAPNFKEVQRLLAKLEMTGKEDEAVAVLEEELANLQKRNKSHEAYEIEMLLVEMLIYKGDSEKASKCKCLEEKEISDARRPLYNAIIKLLSNDNAKAEECWEDFIEARTHLLTPSMTDDHEHFHKPITDFAEFKNVVKQLDIETRKPKNNH